MDYSFHYCFGPAEWAVTGLAWLVLRIGLLGWVEAGRSLMNDCKEIRMIDSRLQLWKDLEVRRLFWSGCQISIESVNYFDLVWMLPFIQV
jgi:hypothetical protein